MGIDVDVTVGESEAGDEAGTGDGEAPPMAYLVKFTPEVTPAEAEGILGHLSPPEEGIVLAGQGAVVVRARQSFVESAKVADSVALVHPVRTAEWEPNRHRVRADDD
jgi:hypothetical protein